MTNDKWKMKNRSYLFHVSFVICHLSLLVAVAPTIAADEPAPAPADAKQKPADEPIPPALTEYLGRTIATTMHWAGAGWLIRAEREREESTSKMIANLGVNEGMTVCDLGAGNGYLTLKLAKLVGDKGIVYANDIQPQMLDMLRERAKAHEVENIRPVLGSLIDARIPEASCDLIVLVDVYHEFSHPVHMLASIRKALKPSGKLVLVEYRAEDPDVPIKPLHKMSKPQIDKELVANGFTLAKSYDELPWQHMVFYERDDAPPETKTGDDAADAKLSE